ncbi:NAD(P)-binding protein [Aspergillus sclerotioniger CBS 115572]|uniref:NAD(P)-binding protein n=1 Tax=Aspergillus sclerotioniger CBS 115572 TaxID=1450535 RepID=A0A317V0M3_9EURO|nr:NAD(P)-binding protein [Aspergillus sclerotioniger CBS 115572]PWY67605.1 NAD(P)-binding protein [Aspergillus sclerotioniger CBS 115572]
MTSLPRQIVLITGANSGIGYETVKALLQSPNPYHIFLGSRNPEKGTQAITSLKTECPNTTNTVEPITIDLTSDESITKAYERVSSNPGRLDILINNAGATFDLAHLSSPTTCTLRTSFTQAYNTNVAGPHVLTNTFIPLLLTSPSPRLLFTSGLSHITQASESYFPTPPQPPGWPKPIIFETIGYRCSKTALNMLMLDWNHKLKADGVKVFGVMPGFLVTNLGGNPEMVREMGGGEASIGGEFIQDVVRGGAMGMWAGW